ncbi:MAG TPA: hypothetical protein VHG51_14840 [Longimicrobiaceae bacterium]|nr:hypothetical protein [Longimicrobiaceae bacterium]
MTGAAAGTVCLLPGGYVDGEGVVHREAEIAPLTGREEELLAALAGGSPAALATEVIARCVRAIGGVRPLTPEVAGRLLVGDRQFLLLRLREATFGERVDGRLACPWPDCGARVDIDFSTADVPVKRCAGVSATYRVELTEEAAVTDAAGAQHRAVTFRLPDGRDQEALAPLLAENPAAALTRLLERCVVGTEEPWDDPAELVARLPARARLEVERAMEERAPAVELEMELLCPECGRAFTAPFDLQDFFFGELRTGRDLLYRQVHYLAYHYHWSEREILELPREKRMAYIGVLADEIEALNDAV